MDVFLIEHLGERLVSAAHSVLLSFERRRQGVLALSPIHVPLAPLSHTSVSVDAVIHLLQSLGPCFSTTSPLIHLLSNGSVPSAFQ
jgi:hypothetical protein